jgi:hypothetical protein
LIEFTTKHGHARPKSTGKESAQIGTWVQHQREKYKSGSLSKERIEQLENIHPTWSWNPIEDDWEFMYKLLKEFEIEHGHTRVIATQRVNGFGLGNWVHVQRGKFFSKRSRAGDLTPERISKLESLASWEWNPTEVDFQLYISAIDKYLEEFGNSRVPTSYKSGDLNLGKWVSHKRNKYSLGKLPLEQVSFLENRFPDWSWSPFKDDWERNLQVLQEFISVNGHVRVPVEHVMGDVRIGSWISNLKSKYKAGRLSAEQIQTLEQSHPTWTWTLLDQQWEEFFELLSTFKKENGHCNVPSKGKTKEAKALYEWINTQRKRLKVGRLPEARKARLDAIGFSFEPIDPWMEAYAMLQHYVAREGSARIPTNHAEQEFTLGRWASTHRGNFRKNELSQEQIKLLEGLKGWDWERTGN